MKIKYPGSDIAARELWNLLDKTFASKAAHLRKILDTLYISTYIFSPNVVYNGENIIDKISRIVRASPSDTICVVRMASPSSLGGRILKKLQEESKNKLGSHCYTVIYSRKDTGFINHAKFFLIYRFFRGFSGGIDAYHGRFYGSTNFTTAGLSLYHSRRGYRLGNYEEFCVRYPFYKRTSRYDLRILEEVLDIITHRAYLYLDSNYLNNYIQEHLRLLRNILEKVRSQLARHTEISVIMSYIDLSLMYHDIASFLYDLPGQELTKRLLPNTELDEIILYPSEIEALVSDHKEYEDLIYQLPEITGLRIGEMRELSSHLLESLSGTLTQIRHTYLPAISEIDRYLTLNERLFLQMIEENYPHHSGILEEVISELRRKVEWYK